VHMRVVSFFREVRAEVLKITWPSRKELLSSIGLVVVASSIAAFLFFLIDTVIYKVLKIVLGM